MIRPAKRKVMSLGFTALALMILYVACFCLHSEAVEERVVLKESTHEGWAGAAYETFLLSPECRQGFWPGSVSAKETENNTSSESSGEMAEAPAVIFQSWRGFALKGNVSHSLRVSIESLRPIGAMNIRKLMASNMSLEDIRSEIRKEEGKVIQRGVVRIGDDIFRLDGIAMVPRGNKTVLDADVSLPKFGSSRDNITTTIGHLNVTLSGKGIRAVSQGILFMKSGKYLGEYRVLLDGQHWGGEMLNEIAGSAMPRRDMEADQSHTFGWPGIS